MRVLLIPYVHGLGHIIRTIPIALELQRRGHTILVACGELGAEHVRFHGLPWSLIHEVVPFPAMSVKMDGAALRAGMIGKLADLAYITRCVDDEISVAREFEPDLIVSDFRHTAGLSAWRLGVPCVSVYNVGIISHVMPGIVPPIGETIARTHDFAGQSHHIWGDAIAVAGWSFFEPLGLIPPEMYASILKSVREIRYVGPILRENPQHLPDKDALRAELGIERALYYVSVGGTGLGAPYLLETLRALEDLDADVVVTAGPNIPCEMLARGARGRSRMTFHAFLQEPLRWMKAADVAVLHGGHISLMEAMLAGTPVVVRPQQGEQLLNGQRAEALGLGSVLPTETEPGPIRDAVERTATDAVIQRRCRSFSERCDATKNCEDLVDYLEAFVRGC